MKNTAIKIPQLILSIILVAGTTAHALEFKSFNFDDDSACSQQLGQLPVSLPYDIIAPNHLAKSKEICLQAYTGDNACRKEYARQKDALGLTSGVRSNHSAAQEKKAHKQCGSWLKSRRSACESFLRKASAVCYQLGSEAQNQQQKEAEELADNLLGTWKGGYDFIYSTGRAGHSDVTLNINRQISNNQFSGIMQSHNTTTGEEDCGAKQRMTIKVYDNVAYLQGSVLSTTCSGWYADNFELDLGNNIMQGSTSDTKDQSGNNVVLRKQ